MATMKTLNGYGFNATEFNGKTSDNYLKKTDTATNSAKLGGKAPKYYIQPRNLLDNSDFEIAQARYGGKHGSTIYAADRWTQNDTTARTYSCVTKNGHGALKCASATRIQQKIELASGVTYTAAVYINDTLNVRTFTANGGEYGSGALRVNHQSDGTYMFIVSNIPANGIVYEPVLYIGSYTADTLPPYVPKGYAAELAECKRYFELLNNGTSQFVRAYNSSTIAFAINYAEKRIGPTISVTGSLTKALNVAGVGTNTPTSISSAYPVGLKSARINAAGTFDTSYTYGIDYNVVKLEINADL